MEVSGTVIVVHIDEFDRDKSHTAFVLNEADTGEMLEPKFEGKPPKSLRTVGRKGSYVYTVTAIDRAGDESQPGGAPSPSHRRAPRAIRRRPPEPEPG